MNLIESIGKELGINVEHILDAAFKDHTPDPKFHWVRVAAAFQGRKFAKQLMYGNTCIAVMYELPVGHNTMVIVCEHFEMKIDTKGNHNESSADVSARMRNYRDANWLGHFITNCMGYPLTLFV